jgi:uncharacterized protein (TIGR00369 family)
VTDEAPDRVEMLRRLNTEFDEYVPHNKALGIRLGPLDDAEAFMTLPWDEKLVGNPETGVIHGGVITSLLDACSGAAVFMALPEPTTIATLDLRIDYMKPATRRETVTAHARCFKLTHNVAFVRCVAYHASEDDPIATGTGTFMLHTPHRRKKKSP